NRHLVPVPRRLVVKRQQVVSIGAKERHGGESSNALLGAIPVGGMGPSPEHGNALGGKTVRDAIGPFPQRRLDETLVLAVGLRAIGSSEAVLDAQGATGSRERPGAKRGPVIGQHPAHSDADSCEIGSARAQKADCRSLALVGMDLRKPDASMIVYPPKQKLPA